MAGAVTGLHVFAADVGPEPLSLLDGNFSPLATSLNTLSNFSNYYVDSGAVNALAVTVNAPQVASAYTDGLMLEVQVSNTTTSATPSLAINGLGARTIVHNDLSALSAGELVATQRILVIYDATNAEWRLLSTTYTGLTLTAPVTLNSASGVTTLTVNVPDSSSVPGINVQSPVSSTHGTFLQIGGNGSEVCWMGHGSAVSGTGVITDLWIDVANGTGGIVLATGSGPPVARMRVQQSAPFLQGWGPTVGGLTDMTPDTGTFTGTLTGFTANPNGLCTWSRNGKQVTLSVTGSLTGTSNAATMTLTGLPAAIQPATLAQQLVAVPFAAFENGGVTGQNVSASVASGSGTVTFYLGASASAWQNSGTKGIVSQITFTYLLN